MRTKCYHYDERHIENVVYDLLESFRISILKCGQMGRAKLKSGSGSNSVQITVHDRIHNISIPCRNDTEFPEFLILMVCKNNQTIKTVKDCTKFFLCRCFGNSVIKPIIKVSWILKKIRKQQKNLHRVCNSLHEYCMCYFNYNKITLAENEKLITSFKVLMKPSI